MRINATSNYPALARGKELIKTQYHNFLLRLAMLMGLSMILVARLTAQTFTTLHSFTAIHNNTNEDGANPVCELVLSGNTLYGAALYGGSFSNGTVFAVNTNGTGFTNLYSFTGGNDGADPRGGLVFSSNSLFGVTVYGGSNNFGTIFKVNTDGTGFTNLYSFRGGSDGGYPFGDLVMSGATLYGTTEYGGAWSNGVVFAINADGTDFTNLYNFTALKNNTNNDGSAPLAGLILSGNFLYGTTYLGGSFGAGTVFAIDTNGAGFTNLYSFRGGGDGRRPAGGLILSGHTLYGTTEYGGSSSNGTIYAINTNGTGFTNLYNFTALNNFTNSDGANPYAGLILSGNTLYGTALNGGEGSGTLFAVDTDGSGFTNLYTFTALNNFTNSDGANPAARLMLAGNAVYGTAEYGGVHSSGAFGGSGTMFRLSLAPVTPPQLTITRTGTNVILTWPASASGFILQSATNLIPSATWNTVSPEPIVLNSLNTVTNSIAGVRMFYRLSQ
jgi:uncharacterized repeat protein (TIGR03803 family)